MCSERKLEIRLGRVPHTARSRFLCRPRRQIAQFPSIFRHQMSPNFALIDHLISCNSLRVKKCENTWRFSLTPCFSKVEECRKVISTVLTVSASKGANLARIVYAPALEIQLTLTLPVTYGNSRKPTVTKMFFPANSSHGLRWQNQMRSSNLYANFVLVSFRNRIISSP
jgi:hypothetical protein